jgi:hypothetical protein
MIFHNPLAASFRAAIFIVILGCSRKKVAAGQATPPTARRKQEVKGSKHVAKQS